jgi:hypothetical protein
MVFPELPKKDTTVSVARMRFLSADTRELARRLEGIKYGVPGMRGQKPSTGLRSN